MFIILILYIIRALQTATYCSVLQIYVYITAQCTISILVNGLLGCIAAGLFYFKLYLVTENIISETIVRLITELVLNMASKSSVVI